MPPTPESLLCTWSLSRRTPRPSRRPLNGGKPLTSRQSRVRSVNESSRTSEKLHEIYAVGARSRNRTDIPILEMTNVHSDFGDTLREELSVSQTKKRHSAVSSCGTSHDRIPPTKWWRVDHHVVFSAVPTARTVRPCEEPAGRAPTAPPPALPAQPPRVTAAAAVQ
jgi:hypothetical protein